MTEFVDVEAMIVTFLDDAVTPDVATQVPADRPDAFVRAWRTGGSAVNRVLDRPLITVQAWELTGTAASDLLKLCRAALFAGYSSMPLVRGVTEVTGPYWDPDPKTGTPRYTFTHQLQVRAHRS